MWFTDIPLKGVSVRVVIMGCNCISCIFMVDFPTFCAKFLGILVRNIRVIITIITYNHLMP